MKKSYFIRLSIGLIIALGGLSYYCIMMFARAPELSFFNRFMALDILHSGAGSGLFTIFYILPLSILITFGFALIFKKYNVITAIWIGVIFVFIVMWPAIIPPIIRSIASTSEENIKVIVLRKKDYPGREWISYLHNSKENHYYLKTIYTEIDEKDKGLDEAYERLRKKAKEIGAEGIFIVEDEYDERGTFSQGKFVRKDLRLPGHAVLFKNSSKAKRAP